MDTKTMQLFAMGDRNGIDFGKNVRGHSAADAMARVFDVEQMQPFGMTSNRFDWPSFYAVPVSIKIFSREYLGPQVSFSSTTEGQRRLAKLKARKTNPAILHDADIPDGAKIGGQRVVDVAVVEDGGLFQGVITNDASGAFSSPDDLDSLEAARAWISQAIDRE